MRTRFAGRRKLFAIEVAQKILLPGTALRRARIETNFQGPHVTCPILAGDTQEVWAFPVSIDVASRSEVAQLRPLLQIR